MILSDDSKLKVWYDFVEKSEEEQNQILDEIQARMSKININSRGNKEIVCPKDLSSSDSDFRFGKIERNIKYRLLSRRKINYDMIQSIEDDLIKFFSQSSTSTFIMRADSKNRRFYLLAVTQYLLLQMRMSINPMGEKVAEIKNTNDPFNAPRQKLKLLLENFHKV